MNKKSLMIGLLTLSSAMSLPGCLSDFQSPAEKKAADAKKPLYERLGGEAGVKAVVADFVARAAANEKVNFTRKGTGKEWPATPENVAKLQKHLVDLIGSLTGGPQKYTGRPLKGSHAGLKISNYEFDWLIGALVDSLKKFKVAEKDSDELVGIVASTRGDIVEVK